MNYFNENKLSAVRQALDMLCDTVARTLGPQGEGILLFDGNGKAYVTKDGISVANHIFSETQAIDGVIQILREASAKTADTVGDGSTTTLILAKALYLEALKQVKTSGLVATKKQLEAEKEAVLEGLNEYIKKISFDKDALKYVATTSANNDSEIGELVASAFLQAGENGTVMFDTEEVSRTYTEFIQGSKYDFGVVSKEFFTDLSKQEASYENACVLCLNGEVKTINDIKNAIIAANGKPLVIFAYGFSEVALQQIALNNAKINAQILPINITGNSFNRKDTLFDLSDLTGAIRYDMVPKAISNITLGKCNRVVASIYNTIISVDDNEKIQKTTEILKSYIENEKDQGQKEYLKKRLNSFRGNLAIIHVGGTTQVEIKERYDRIEDSICAVRAALNGGIVEGGGFTYWKLSNRADCKLMNIPLKMPLKTLCEHSNIDKEIVAMTYVKQGLGCNFTDNSFVDLFKAGIVDPADVIRNAIENAVSVVIQLLSVGAIIER